MWYTDLWWNYEVRSSEEWRKAMDEEVWSLNDNKTFATTTLLKSMKTVGVNGFTQSKQMQMEKKNSKHDLLRRVTAR